MTTSINSVALSSHGSAQSSDGRETKKYLLLRDTIAKAKWPHGTSSRTRLRSKRTEQRVLKGSLWQEMEENPLNPNYMLPPTTKSLQRSASGGAATGAASFKQSVESIEIEDLTLQCASAFLAEISSDTCRLLLAIPTSEERFYVHSDSDRIYHAVFINVGSDVIVSKRNIPPCRATVKWKGRLAGRQGVWFGVEIMDEQSKGTGDCDGSNNNVRLFSCDKNNGMFVNIGQLILVPPKRPMRRPKKKAPSTPSLGSENNFMIGGSLTSDQYTNDLMSQTESELSFMDDGTSAETAPLVDLQINDRIAWPSERGYEKAFVRWIGTLPEESPQSEILVGVEFDNPIGKGTGVYRNRRLFEAKKGHASLVPLEGLIKITSSSPSLRNLSDSSSQRSLPMSQGHNGHCEESPRGDFISATDVLDSLAINDSSDQESSDHNNNSGQLDLKTSPRDVMSSYRLTPPTQSLNLIGGDRLTESPDVPVHLRNGSANHSTSCSRASLSSSDNLMTSADNAGDHQVQHYSVPMGGLKAAAANSNHPPLNAADGRSPLSGADTVGINGSDDIDPLLLHEKPRQFSNPQLKTFRSPVTSYQISKLRSVNPMTSFRSKHRNRNGLHRLHSLDVEDMHDIVDELSLNSSPSLSLDTLAESVSHPPPTYNNIASTTGEQTINTHADSADDDVNEHLDNHLESPSSAQRQYLLVKMTSQSPTNHISSLSSSQTLSEEEGSYSPFLERVISPLVERTTSSSFDNTTDSSMMQSDITVIPAPLTDSHTCEHEDPSECAIPDPPPEFMSDSNAVIRTGLWKGIAGTAANSSNFMEPVLYLLSVSTDILCSEDLDSSYQHLKKMLIENISTPLKSNELFVEAATMVQWRQQLDSISTGQMLSTGSMRELQKFIALLLQHICSIHPLYELNNQDAGYAMTLMAYKDARVGFPTVQKLLEKTCIQRKVKFSKVPNTLILILPRWSANRELIFPNLHIDLTDVLEYAKRICHMCGEQAVFECPECYENELVELSAAAFCEPCSQTVHKHSKRINHMPVQLKMVRQMGDEEDSILILKGVLTVRDNHYISLSEPPPLSPSMEDSQADPEWLQFDCKAATKESVDSEHTYFIPEVRSVPSVANWLSMDAYDHVARDVDSIPANIQRLLQECCMCVYSKS